MEKAALRACRMPSVLRVLSRVAATCSCSTVAEGAGRSAGAWDAVWAQNGHRRASAARYPRSEHPLHRAPRQWGGSGNGKRSLSGKVAAVIDAEASQYEKKTQVEHVLHRPDVYVGSMEAIERQMLVYDIKTQLVQHRSVSYVPGLLKLFDEILVNAADNKIRDPSMNRLEVKIDQRTNTVSVWNNGRGIPVIKHKKYDNIYVPELVMGNLLAGSNFDDTQKRLGGGRHGYGAKLTNIFSTSFSVETLDSERKLLYKQTWRDNMSICEPADITSVGPGAADYTCITFSVDMKRFSKKKKLDSDIIALWSRRVLDIAGCNTGVKCFLNGKLVRVKGLGDLATQYLAAIESNKPAQADSTDAAASVVEVDIYAYGYICVHIYIYMYAYIYIYIYI